MEQLMSLMMPNRIDNSHGHGHVLIVARYHIPRLAELAKQYRERTGFSVGLWQMAEERGIDMASIAPIYHKFDYVLRHYYRDPLWNEPTNQLHLRALGNLTCAAGAGAGNNAQHDLPSPAAQNSMYPKWGLHWVMLDAKDPYLMTTQRRNVASHWPIAQRQIECEFQGSDPTPKFGQSANNYERGEMKTALHNVGQLPKQQQQQCTISFTPQFGKGSGPFQYHSKLANTKICPSPRGWAVETHRMTEAMIQGCVPAVKDEPYLHKLFRPPPVIVGQNWTELARNIQYYLQRPEELQQLSTSGVEFIQEYQQCVRQDLDYILQHAFGLVVPLSST